MKYIIAGGGTGGHIYPAIAIARAILRKDAAADILFVGANGKMEMEKVPKEGFKIIGLDIAGFNRSNVLKNITLPFKIWKSRQKALQILKSFKPDIVIGVGGFASFPMLNAAQSLNIPTLIQEQNSYAGKTNKIIGKKAKSICVAYDNMEQFFPKDKIVKTGNPVRDVIVEQTVSKNEALQFWKLDDTKLTVLVIGGSLGAKTINESIAAGLEQIINKGVQVIWQTGKLYKETGASLADKYKGSVLASEFIYEMDKAYAAADIVVSRAGALSIAELCIVAKPTVFVPYPFAAEDHQTSNAMALVNKDAAWIVKDADANSDLVPKLLQLIDQKQIRETMKHNISKLGVSDADDRIVNEIFKIIQK